MNSELIQRLRAIRATVRRRLALYGFCVTAGGGLLALTVIVFLDWWLWLPALLRVAVVVGGLLGGAAAAAHWIVRPLRAPLALTELAGKLERYFPNLGDRLTGAVGLLEAGGTTPEPPVDLGSAMMVRRTIEDTEETVRYVPLERALTLRPLGHGACLGVLAVALAVLVAWVAPGWYRTGVVRYARPFSPQEWPRRVALEPLQGDIKVALGGSVQVRLRVTRGLDADLRGLVRLRDAAGELGTFAMQREGTVDFQCTVDAIVRDLTYWFEADDASTAATPGRITVVTPPAVVEANVRVDAPGYAQPRPPVEFDLAAGEVRAVIGSRLTVSVRPSRPVGRDDRDQPTASMEFDAAPVIPLEFQDPEATGLVGSFELQQSDTFRIVLKDADGFESASRRSYRLIATADEPPTVTVLEPAAVTEVTPSGSVVLAVRAEDDFGVRRVQLAGELLNRSQSIDLPLADYPREDTAGSRAGFEVRRAWELAPLKLRAGDMLEYRVAVTDNYAYESLLGHSVSSPPLRLKLVHPADLENRLRDEFSLFETRIRQILLDQESMRDEVSATPPADSTGQVESVRRLARRQFQLADQVQRLAERFHRIAERVRLNGLFDEPTRRQVGQAAQQLRGTGTATMPQAARALEQASDPRPDSALRTPHSALSGAASAQSAAVEELRQVLRWMGRWGDFQEAVAKARDLLDRQQQIRASTLRQAAESVGKPVATLTEEEQARLKRVVREEKQLALDMDQWLRKGQSLLEPLRGKDPASAEALEGALRVAAAQQIFPRMEKAAAALVDNRTAAASLEQRAVEVGLTQVLAALEVRQVRELAELRKSVERFLDAVAELVRTQETLATATQEALGHDSTSEALLNLADEQRTLRRNTGQLGKEVEESPSAAQAARDIQRAVPPMERAEQAMRVAAGDWAITEQGEAQASLQAALAELERLAAQTEHQFLRMTLAQTRRQLEDLRDRQAEVNGSSAALVEIVRTQGKLNRPGARRASQLSAQQGELREQTRGVGQELEKVVVYVWVLEHVGGRMETSRDALAERRLDPALLENQHGIISELGRLLDALAALEALPPPDEFADGQGDGGESPGQNQPPVPPVAELMVLKTMQEALYAKTAALHAARTGDTPSEEELRQARAIGREQEQLRELTERVTRKARSGD